MKTRVFTLLTALALLAVELRNPFVARIQATVDDPLPIAEFPGSDVPVDIETRQLIEEFKRDLNSYLMTAGRGTICAIDSAGKPSDPIYPLGPAYTGPINFAFDSFQNEGLTPDLLLAGTANPSPQPLFVFAPGPPWRSVGDIAVAEIARGGIRIATGNFAGGPTPEFVFAFGRGGRGAVTLTSVETDFEIEFTPFGPGYTGGIQVAAGDVNGDGRADLLAAQESGGEALVFSFDAETGRFIPLVGGRPYGHDYNGGVNVTLGDLNNDRRAEIVTGRRAGQAHVRVFSPIFTPQHQLRLRLFADFVATDRATDGVGVAAGVHEGRPVLFTSWGDLIDRVRFDDRSAAVFVDPAFNSHPFGGVAPPGGMVIQTFTPRTPR